MKMRKIQKQLITAGAIALVALIAMAPVQSLAADEAILFGSEVYEWDTEDTYDIGIYATSDEVIEEATYTVSFDSNMLQLDSEDAAGEDGEIRVSVEGNDTNVLRTTLSFIPQCGGTTKVTVGDVVITTENGDVEVLDSFTAPVHIEPDEECALTDLLVNGVSIFSENTAEYSLTVSGRVTDANITTVPEDIPVTISDTALSEGNNTIRIMTGEEGGEQAQYVLHIKRETEKTSANIQGNETESSVQTERPKVQKASSEIEQRAKEILRNNTILLVVIWAIAIAFVIFGIIRIQRKRQKRIEKAENYHRELIRMAEEKRLRDKEVFATVDDLSVDETDDSLDIVNKTKEMMSSDIVVSKPEICVRNVTMDFKREKDEATSVKEMVIRTLKGQREVVEFRALDNISFDVYKGEVVGIIGTNGSGKSTILKIVSGALNPTNGSVQVNRSKLQLLSLGTGFDLELTGKENVYLNGAIIGYTKEYINEVYDEIVEFAELEGFMDEKVRNYSSGMVSRLGFAIATTRDAPDILILDEVLSVGDMFFRKKSEKRIQELIHGGATVLIVSHSTAVIEKNCSKVIWIEKGKLRAIGNPKEVCKAYTELTKEEK